MTAFKCDLCHGGQFRLIYPARGQVSFSYLITDTSYGQHGQIVSCSACSLVQVFPVTSHKRMTKRYSDFIDPLYEQERARRSKNYIPILRTIDTLVPKPGRLLDVGCATGAMLGVAQDMGWQVTGIEPSRWAAAIGRKQYGLDIMHGSFETIAKLPKNFDVVSAIDAIEHLASPRKFVLLAKSVLKPGGILCLVTPDIGSLLANIMGEKWWHIRPDHIYYFNQNTLSRLLISQGFKLEQTKRYRWTFSLNYWASRLKIHLPSSLGNLPLTLNFHDSIEIYARKI